MTKLQHQGTGTIPAWLLRASTTAKFTSPVGRALPRVGLYGSLGRPKRDRSGKNVKSVSPLSNRVHSCATYSMGLDKCIVCPPFQ